MITIHTNSYYADILITDKLYNDFSDSHWDSNNVPSYVFDISDNSLQLMAGTVRSEDGHRIFKIDFHNETTVNIENFDAYRLLLPSGIIQIKDVDTGTCYFEYEFKSQECKIFIKDESIKNFTHIILEGKVDALPIVTRKMFE